MRKAGFVLIVMALVLAFSGMASAQGVSLGAALGEVQISPENSDLDSVTGVNWQVDAYYGFSKQWAIGLKGVFGNGEKDDVTWNYTAVDVVGRYLYSINDQWGVYGEAGLGYYDASADVSISGYGKVTVDADAVLGYCMAIGGLYQAPHFYVGPEIGFQSAPFDKGSVDGTEIDDIDTVNATTIMIKAGYKF